MTDKKWTGSASDHLDLKAGIDRLKNNEPYDFNKLRVMSAYALFDVNLTSGGIDGSLHISGKGLRMDVQLNQSTTLTDVPLEKIGQVIFAGYAGKIALAALRTKLMLGGGLGM